MVFDPLPTRGKGARIKLSQAASGMIVPNQRRLRVSIFFSVKIAALEALKNIPLVTQSLQVNFHVKITLFVNCLTRIRICMDPY